MGHNTANMMLRTLLAVGIAVATADMTCPSTPASLACGMKVTTTASASCADVLGEMNARIAGQYGAWHDPHNNGTYSVESYGGTFSTSRLTGDGKYTDKQIFTLTDQSGSCLIEACSRSQVTSLFDKGTNYCDVKMLFCGSKDGCKPVKNDFSVGQETTSKFAQASVDMGACLAVSEAQVPVGRGCGFSCKTASDCTSGGCGICDDGFCQAQAIVTELAGVAPPCHWQLDEAHCMQSNNKDTCEKEDPLKPAGHSAGFAEAGTCNSFAGGGNFPVCCTVPNKGQFWYRKGLSCANEGWQSCPETASDDETTLYKISGGECGQATLDSKYASYAEKFAGLTEGTCAAQGYTVGDGAQTLKVPVLGDITIAKFKQTATSAIETDSCSLYEILGTTCSQSDIECKYTKYAKLAEKGLKDGTCSAQGYTVKGKVNTMKYPIVGDITITQYTKPTVAELGAEKCCTDCVAPEVKYFSVDVPHGFCGETCINPKKYFIFKLFEKNLTKAIDNTPCIEQFTPTGGHYTNYTSTVTHGVPGLKVTLDLYGPV